MNKNHTDRNRSQERANNSSEQGFMLVGLIVAIFLILLALSVAAPTVARDLRREREVEAVHRGNQYVRAIRLYYKKTGMYPGSIEMLEKSNNIRYLRQRYVDPLTGKADWRLVHVGEAKTTVKGFFGQPLAGIATGLGAAAGMVSPSPGGSSPSNSSPTSSPSAFGGSGTTGFGSSSGSTGFGSSSPSSPSAFGSSGTTGLSSSSPSTGGTGSPNSGANNTLGSVSDMASSTSGTGMPTGGAPFVGVGIPKQGDSITVLNEQTTYNTWEFLYDPRIEQLYAKGSLLGGVGSGGLGSASSMTSGAGGTNSSFGNPSTTPGFNSTPGTSTPATPTTTPPQQ